MIIPDEIVFFGFLAFYVYQAVFLSEALFINLLSAFAAASFLLVLHLITLGKGMGLGDVKLALLGGLVLGPSLTIVWMFSSFIAGAFVGTVLLGVGKAKLGVQIAFGPFMVIGFFISLFWGDYLANALLSSFSI